jgi:bZIP-type transcription factor MBZ1
MLLSSPAFSGFLNELSTNGMPAPPATTTSTQQSQTKSQPRSTHKDVNPHQASRQMQNQQPQINMAMIPETDFSVLEQPMNTWNSIPSNDYQVFSVSAVPEVPILDLMPLSRKASSSPITLEAPKDTPQITELPAWVNNTAESVTTSSSEDENEAFALYNDTPSSTTTLPYSLNSFLASAKPESTKFMSDISAATDESSSLAQLKRMCAAMDEISEPLAAYLPDE